MKKEVIKVIVILGIIIITVGLVIYFKHPSILYKKEIEESEFMSLKELYSLCKYTEDLGCEDHPCEGMKFNVTGYISQSLVEANLIPDEGRSYKTNYFNHSEYTIGFQVENTYPEGSLGLGFIFDDSLVLTNGEPDKGKINEIVKFFDELLEDSYYKYRKVSFEVEIQKRDCYTYSGRCLSCDKRVIKNLKSFKLHPEADVTFPKEALFKSVENCNEIFREIGGDDTCFGYHYYHRGCYYDTIGLKQCIISYGGSSIKYYSELHGLNYNESKDLCLSLEHKGLAADCLKHLGETNEECLNFAKDDEYLLAICNLEEGGIINFTARGINDF